jgi:radial spoke head protein 4A
MKMTEGFEWKSAEELNNLEEWGNTNAAITNGGRTTHVAPDGLDDEAKEAYLAEQGEKDPLLERFRGINEHTPMPGLEFSWVKKIVGDTQQYNQPGDKGPVSYCVNVLKSLRWPGAYTVHKQGKFCSIYVGYGLKHGDASMNPTEPPEVQRDPEDQEEMPEPTPLVAPQEPPEPDTDAVEKEEEDE